LDESKLFQHVGVDHARDSVNVEHVSFWKDVSRRFFSSKGTIFCLLILILIFLGCLFFPFYNSDAISGINATSINAKPGAAHWLGADRFGHDVFLKAWSGGRLSFLVGFTAAFLQAVIGVIVGIISGYYGGKIDMVLMRIVDILISIPYLIVVLAIQVVLGRGVGTIIFALVATGWLNIARLTRGQTLQINNEDYIMAAQTLGVKDHVIMLRHFLPNILGIILVSITLAIPQAMFSEAFLSFIGLGTSDISWGSLIRTGMEVRSLAPWQLIWPSILLSATMLCIQLIGDSLRDALDPKLRK